MMHRFLASVGKWAVRKGPRSIIPCRRGLYRPLSDVATKTTRSFAEIYERKSPLEHILLRPGMYIGPTERSEATSMWVPDKILSSTEDAPVSLTRRDCSVVPALVKIFDEILVNASDNRLRHPKSSTQIKVTIRRGSPEETPLIQVYNDGQGIPVAMHPTEHVYIPELLFGHLLTGSNFNDNEKRVTGGRHGYGAKLANVFSTEFRIEVVDAERGLRYEQRWKDNMTVASEPIVTPLDDENVGDSICISLVPDLRRLYQGENYDTIHEDDYAYMSRRVIDIAGCAAGQVQVELNGTDVSFATFGDYISLYRSSSSFPQVVFEEPSPRWKVAVGLCESGSSDSISFVNGVSTSRGGTHVKAIAKQLVKPIQDAVEKLDPTVKDFLNPSLVRRHLFIACDTLIENPTFDSQMKECLTSAPHTFGSSCELSNDFIKQLSLSEDEGGPGILEFLLDLARNKQRLSVKKQLTGVTSKRQVLSIAKLEDAHDAGTATSADCTLILTEGDSAKALAVAGLEVVGRNVYGVFPLRGKFLNVRHASVEQLTKNAEVKALCTILGLDFEKSYDTADERATLRYGHVMLMTDQDTDGSHIKGLVINFFRFFWPSLLQHEMEGTETRPFLSFFVTPLLKAKSKTKKTDVHTFYTNSEYQTWRDALSSKDLSKYVIKYYKGLGTSTAAEAKQYFLDFDKHIRHFSWKSDADGELLDMVFTKERAADRRQWILDEFDEDKTLDVDTEDYNTVSYQDFVNDELVHFSHGDNIRSIPSAIDGLKPSQRKVLYACRKRKLKDEIKVAQLTGYCAETTAYHHGEASLQSTSMAQDFVGSNNINLLVPSGQFGTRLAGGKDAASPRYIFTYLSPLCQYLFPEVDDQLLTYREDDGQLIEPEYFCPIIPLLLVNGSQGIGTGWSTCIPPHDPNDIISHVRGMIQGSEGGTPPQLEPLTPHIRGFKGTIDVSSNGFKSFGIVKESSSNTVTVSELPVGIWTDSYKAHLIRMRDRAEIVSFHEDHTTTDVSYTIKVRPIRMKRYKEKGFDKVFQLYSSLPTTNMNAFDAQGRLLRFEKAEDIIESFFPVRFALYEKRKERLQATLAHEAAVSSNKAKFIQAVSEGRINLTESGKSKEALLSEIRSLGCQTRAELSQIRCDGLEGERQANENDDFDYLLSMPISSLTTERIDSLISDSTTKQEALGEMQKTAPAELWHADLNRLEAKLKS